LAVAKKTGRPHQFRGRISVRWGRLQGSVCPVPSGPPWGESCAGSANQDFLRVGPARATRLTLPRFQVRENREGSRGRCRHFQPRGAQCRAWGEIGCASWRAAAWFGGRRAEVSRMTTGQELRRRGGPMQPTPCRAAGALEAGHPCWGAMSPGPGGSGIGTERSGGWERQ